MATRGKVPVLFGPGNELAASILDKPAAVVTWAEAAQVADATGTHNIVCLHTALDDPGWPFLRCRIDGLAQHEFRATRPDGTPALVQRYETPDGSLTTSLILSVENGVCPGEHLLKDEQDIPALTWLLEATARHLKTERTVSEQLAARLAAVKREAGTAFPTLVGMTPPAFSLMLAPYMDKETALFFVHDRPELMDRFIECQWNIQNVWLEAAAENDVDVYRIAVNGLEWLSFDLYERYMIPQTRRIAAFAAARGKLSWIHTCGKLKKLAAAGVYCRMGLDVVESLSAPPTGDIDDLQATRRHIGARATRGGLNNELFYAGDTRAIARQTESVLDAVAGFRHMLGDTNPPAPPYRQEAIQSVIDLVRARGQLLE